MDQGLIPNRYAKALYKFALEINGADRVYELMKNVAVSFVEHPQLNSIMANPYVPSGDKTGLLTTAAHASGADICYADFLKLLVKNKRIEFIRGIALTYLDIYRKANNIYLVKVTTASNLPDAETARLKALVEKHLGDATVEYTQEVDPELIGGFVISVNSERLDASVSNEIKQLRLKLLSN